MKSAIEIAKACIARWHDTTDDNVIENIMTTDVASIIDAALAEREAQAVQQEREKVAGLIKGYEKAQADLWQIINADSTRKYEGCVNGVRITYGEMSMAAQIVLNRLRPLYDAITTYNDNRKG